MKFRQELRRDEVWEAMNYPRSINCPFCSDAKSWGSMKKSAYKFKRVKKCRKLRRDYCLHLFPKAFDHG